MANKPLLWTIAALIGLGSVGNYFALAAIFPDDPWFAGDATTTDAPTDLASDATPAIVASNTAPAFDPSAFRVTGVWQLSDNYKNSWCTLGIYHIDADGTYWVDRGWQNEESGSDEGTWALKAPTAKAQKGVKAVLVFTPKPGPGRLPYRFEIRSSDPFRFSAFGFDDGDGPTGENIMRVEFEQISNQTVLDAFAQDCGTKPGEASDGDGGQT